MVQIEFVLSLVGKTQHDVVSLLVTSILPLLAELLAVPYLHQVLLTLKVYLTII